MISNACASLMEATKGQPILPIEPKSVESKTPNSAKCFHCGYRYPHQGDCLAKGKTCTACQRLNHFASVCQDGRRNRREPNRTIEINFVRMAQIIAIIAQAVVQKDLKTEKPVQALRKTILKDH